MLKNIAAAAVVTCAGMTGLSAATLVNGSFEQPGAFNGGFQTLGAGSTALTGWTVGGAGIDHIRNHWQASDGNYSLDMSSTGAGTVSQSVTGLVVGATYNVLFDMAANPDRFARTVSIAVEMGKWASEVFTFDSTGATRSNMNWEERTLSFVAQDTSGLLYFGSGEANAWGPALDNVRIEMVASAPAPVPLPAGAALLAGALGVLGLRRRAA